MTHKEKMQETAKLKKDLYTALERVWIKGENVNLQEKDKDAVWGIVSWKMQSAYNKGRTTGWNKGFADGIVVNVKKIMDRVMKK